MSYTDQTNDPALSCWLDSANDPASDFPLQNLPYGVFRKVDSDDHPRIGVAIGDSVLDIFGCLEAGLLSHLDSATADVLAAENLNAFMGLGQAHWQEARSAISTLLQSDHAKLRDDAGLRNVLLIDQRDAKMLLPAAIGDYTDFYASHHHATNVGRMFRPDGEPLLPNYKHLPVGYHGRASTVIPSETPIRRPQGQIRPIDTKPPLFGPCRLLDYELEMGVFVGPGNEMGTRIDMKDTPAQLFGLCILNDWSARDIQKWEYVPLGPFNAKNFASTISPWVVTMDALAPFRVAGPPRTDDDPAVLPYLEPTEDMALNITVEAWLSSKKMRDQQQEAIRLSRGNFREMYWTFAQMLAHHSSTGCAMRPGDLLGSGTISGPTEAERGCLLELTWRGTQPISLPDGTERKFLQDGDELTIKAYCEAEGTRRIGFGACRGVIEAAE